MFIVYTTQTGGIMKVIWGTEEQYELMKRTREVQEGPYLDNPPPPVKLMMVSKAKPHEVWDFVLERDRLAS